MNCPLDDHQDEAMAKEHSSNRWASASLVDVRLVAFRSEFEILLEHNYDLSGCKATAAIRGYG